MKKNMSSINWKKKLAVANFTFWVFYFPIWWIHIFQVASSWNTSGIITLSFSIVELSKSLLGGSSPKEDTPKQRSSSDMLPALTKPPENCLRISWSNLKNLRWYVGHGGLWVFWTADNHWGQKVMDTSASVFVGQLEPEMLTQDALWLINRRI